MNSVLLSDGYKLGHHKQYPEGTTLVFSNFTPRSDKHAVTPLQDKGVVVFGVQLMLQQLHEHFNNNFFKVKEREEFELFNPTGFQEALAEQGLRELRNSTLQPIKQELDMYLGIDYDISHFESLWDLGYLPIEVRALDEGSICPIRTPMLTIHNTLPEFFWITNYLETIISNLLWKPMTSATIAHAYRQLLNSWAIKTTGSIEGVEWQGHDFSMRGMDSIDAVVSSGLGHLTSFNGTDSLPTIWGARHYYGETGFVAGSVPATEHSVMCAGSKEGELETFRRLLNTYPTGILSVVSDTWDLWNVITNILPQLKEEILARDGKLVIRPDSGDPVDIICGESNSDVAVSPQNRGVVQLLWDIFGGTTNKEGYKVLDPHIGAIYGDSITLERADEICRRLEAKGFASTNVVLGIGSFTYQYNTRDTFGFAMKATYVEKNGEGFEIFKDPVTDSGMKKSAKGLVSVIANPLDGSPTLVDQCTWETVNSEENLLKIRYKDGKFFNTTTLTDIKNKLNGKN